MAKHQEISATMASALVMMADAGGELIRYVGGYWAAEKAVRDHNGVPHPHHGTPTIEALVARKRAEYTQWQERSRGGRPFPVRVRILEQTP